MRELRDTWQAESDKADLCALYDGIGASQSLESIALRPSTHGDVSNAAESLGRALATSKSIRRVALGGPHPRWAADEYMGHEPDRGPGTTKLLEYLANGLVERATRGSAEARGPLQDLKLDELPIPAEAGKHLERMLKVSSNL